MPGEESCWVEETMVPERDKLCGLYKKQMIKILNFIKASA